MNEKKKDLTKSVFFIPAVFLLIFIVGINAYLSLFQGISVRYVTISDIQQFYAAGRTADFALMAMSYMMSKICVVLLSLAVLSTFIKK